MRVEHTKQIAWAAGLFEGEGCITNAGKNSARLMMHMTDRDVMERFCLIVGVGRVREEPRTKQKGKTLYLWEIGARDDVTSVLFTFLPWVGDRRKTRAKTALARLRNNQGSRDRNRTHCDQGHLYDAANTYIETTGKRRCRTCMREWDRNQRRRKMSTQQS